MAAGVRLPTLVLFGPPLVRKLAVLYYFATLLQKRTTEIALTYRTFLLGIRVMRQKVAFDKNS